MQQLTLQQAYTNNSQLARACRACNHCTGRQLKQKLGIAQPPWHWTTCSISLKGSFSRPHANHAHVPRTAVVRQSGTSGPNSSSSSNDPTGGPVPAPTSSTQASTSSLTPAVDAAPLSTGVVPTPGSGQQVASLQGGAASPASTSPGGVQGANGSSEAQQQGTEQAPDQQQAGEAEKVGEVEEEEAAVPWYKRPLLTWGLFLWTWWLFVQQWWPLWPALTSPCYDGWGEAAMRLAGFCLVQPSTEVVTSMQMDMAAFLAGNWGTAIPAAFLHSGFAPTLLFSLGLLDAGQVLEMDGPLMMGIQVAVAAGAAGLAQSLAIPGVPATLTGPAMVCGLHVAVAARATYSLYLARQQLKEEVASEPDEPEAEPIVQSNVQAVLPSKLGVACCVVGILLGLYIPNLSVWGILGGMAGGLIGAATAHWVIIGLRSIAWLALTIGINLLMFLSALPVLLLRMVMGVVSGAVSLVADLLASMRRS